MPDYVEHTYFWIPFEVQKDVIGLSGKKVWDRLGDIGVETHYRFNKPLYEQFVFTEHEEYNREFPWSEKDNGHDYELLLLHNVEDVVSKMISLPNKPNFKQGDVGCAVETVQNFRQAMQH